MMFPVKMVLDRWLVEARSENFSGISCTFLPHVMDRNRKGTASVFKSSNILMQGSLTGLFHFYDFMMFQTSTFPVR